MTEFLLISGLLLLLIGIVSLRFFILLIELGNEERSKQKKEEFHNRKWFDEEHIRRTEDYED